MNLQGHRNDSNESRLVICSSMTGVSGSARLWLSCQAIIWISLLVGLLQSHSHMLNKTPKTMKQQHH